jgi:glycosyltransferase involved in cell wall biosynthesis
VKVVISGYVGKKLTGIARNLIPHLEHVDDNNEYIVYTNFDIKNEFIINNKSVTIKSYNVSKNSSIGNLLWTTFIFPFVVLKEKADAAVIPNFTLLLFKFKPTIWILHDLIEFNVENKFSKLRMFYRKCIADPISAHVATHIVTVSKNSKKDIIKFLKIKENKITVIYNGIDRNKFKTIDKEKAKADVEKYGISNNFILFIGTIDYPGKNVHGLIKAFEILKSENKYEGDLVLIGGKGHNYQVIEDMARSSKYSKNIIFPGYVSDEDIISFYNTCDLFCFLSYYEGFGAPPLEALSCGAKVLVSNKSSLPEVVGPAGWITTIDSAKTVAQKIYDIIHTENILYTNKTAYETHLEQFNWNNYSKEFSNVLNRVIKK